MANNHRIVVNPGSLPFSTFPIQIKTTTPFVANYQATSNGRVIAATGTKIWDTSILSATGLITVTPQTPLTFPFTTLNLPSTYFDAVLLLSINNIRYIHSFSNSPDNLYTNNLVTQTKNVYAATLRCYSLNENSGGDANVNNHYMFGGLSSVVNSHAVTVIFASPTTTALTMTASATFINYNGTIYPPKVISFVVPINTLTYTTVNLELLTFYDNLGLFNTNRFAGYYKIVVTTTDNSYASSLPVYHWGQAST